MITITRTYWFSSAHVLQDHPKCGRLHGHNYRVDVTVGGESLNDNGMIRDFQVLDEAVKPILKVVDHKCIISEANVKGAHEVYIYLKGTIHIVVLEIKHSTAEELTYWFARELSTELQGSDLWIQQIDIWETPKSKATWTSS